MCSTLSSSMPKKKSKSWERNTLPLISWTIEKEVKAFTNKQLKMYLKQKGLKISGSVAELIERVLTHARGNHSARDAVEHEEPPNLCELSVQWLESQNTDDTTQMYPWAHCLVNHNYIKILESDWSLAVLIWALIVQLYASCLSNCTVRVIKRALVALEWIIFFSI